VVIASIIATWLVAGVVIGRLVQDEPPATAATPSPVTSEAPESSTAAAETTAAPLPEITSISTFRGGERRAGPYGVGPVPQAPGIAWSFPRNGGMCRESVEFGETTTWCGTGWTGQPSVFVRDGRTWVVFGAYDGAVHFLDQVTGEAIIPAFQTGDIIKGSVSVDPTYPIVYSGSRDGYLRAIAIDRPEPVELWRLSASAAGPPVWNDDWDPSPIIRDGWLITGGENSYFHVVKLNQSIGADGLVAMNPELVWSTPGWDDELLRSIGGNNVSIENSVAMHGDVAYFANSGGLVQGWDLGPLLRGEGTPAQTFRFWTGDDTDASIVIDDEGMLYVGVEWERHLDRARDVGQFVKLNPADTENPVVWSIPIQHADKDGVWGTAAIHRDLLVVPTYTGRLLGIDRTTGTIRWERRLPAPLMGSPVIVDDTLIVGDCGGLLHAYDVRDTGVDPPELWSLKVGGCVEATPVVWKGWIFVGTRAGRFVGVA